MKTVEEIHRFWKNPNKGKNAPEDYLEGSERTMYLINLIGKYVSKSSRILEIGCNVGRNLSGLFETGYRNLIGIEINKNALEKLRESFPDLSEIQLFNAAAEIQITQLPSKSVDVIYTMAVLEHIHIDSERTLFENMVRVAKGYIITIEDERKVSERHFTRNYQEVFESLGLKQIESQNCRNIIGLGKSYMMRIFKCN